MSGYNELHDALGQTHGRGPVRLLQKPFRVAELAAQMREALGWNAEGIETRCRGDVTSNSLPDR